MKYHYFQPGKKTFVINSTAPLSHKELEDLVQGPFSFVLLKNEHVLCVNEEGNIMRLPYNRVFKQEDIAFDIGDGIRGSIVEGRVDTKGEFIGIE